jgi:hypothetical protein
MGGEAIGKLRGLAVRAEQTRLNLEQRFHGTPRKWTGCFVVSRI